MEAARKCEKRNKQRENALSSRIKTLEQIITV